MICGWKLSSSVGALETGNAEVICNHSLEMEPTKERKRVKVSMQDIATQGLESTSSGAEETSSAKRWELGRKCNRKENDVKKSTRPRKNGFPESKTGLADQIDYQAPLNQFTATQKSSGNQIAQEDQEGCLASTLKSEPHTGSEVKDGREWGKETMRISSHGVARKEYCDSLKARVAELRQETFMLSCQLQKRANKCMKLRDANRLLMDELKKMCEQFVIDILEAKNPDNGLPTE